MKTFAILTLGAVILLAGCDSMSTRMSDRFDAVPPQVLIVDGKVEQVYSAAQKAFKRLDFTLTRSVMGRVEAASAINTSVAFGDSRQTVARVRISQGEPGKSVVELAISEEVTSSSVGGTHQQAVREHSFYQTYFAMLQQVLAEEAADAGTKNN
jgi:hypothetical protein